MTACTMPWADTPRGDPVSFQQGEGYFGTFPTDTGCQESRSCLSCPLPEYRYVTAKPITPKAQTRELQVLVPLARANGRTISAPELGKQLGLSPHQVIATIGGIRRRYGDDVVRSRNGHGYWLTESMLERVRQ